MKQLTCIVCPNGCRITAELVGGQYVFTGSKCMRGAEFARTELTAPTRSVTTTVRTTLDHMPALPVKTKGEIPKALVKDIVRALADVTIKREIKIGETVVENILNTGVDVIACDSIAASGVMRVPIARSTIGGASVPSEEMCKPPVEKEYSHV